MTRKLAKVSQVWKVVMVGVLILLGSFQGVGAAPPEPAVNIRTRLQPYQTSGLSPSHSSAGRFLQEAPSPAQAPERPISALAQQTLHPVADAVILQGYPAVNFGDTIDMWAGYDDSLEPDGMIARSLIKFNLVGLPPSQTITKATLRVYLISSWDFPNTTRTVTAYRITSDWSENSVTWSSVPGYGSSYGSRSIGQQAWGWHEFDVTDLARNWYNGTSANYGVMLRGPEISGVDSSWRGFSTREGSYPPGLVVEYQEPIVRPNPLTATPSTQTQINLSWNDNSNNETGFKIERSPDGVSGWRQITTVGANVTTYANVDLACNTTYFYQVRAYNAAGNSAYSDTASAKTLPCSILPPAAPTNLTATAISGSQINLSWQDSSNSEIGFKIERSLNGINWSHVGQAEANVTTYQDANLPCGTTFFYRVLAHNSGGNSLFSNAANAATLTCNAGNTSLFLPLILKSPVCVPGPNQPPAFPDPLSIQTTTEFKYNDRGQLVGAVTTILVSPAIDPNCDPLTYTWSATNGSIIGSDSTATWNRVIEFGRIKSGDVTVIVRDGKGGSDGVTIKFQ